MLLPRRKYVFFNYCSKIFQTDERHTRGQRKRQCNNRQLTRKIAIVEYLDYQIPVIQLKGPKENGDMQAAKRD